MSDDENKPRPNAHYKLSNEHTPPDQIVYHYNREQRLAKAPQAVRDLYKTEQPRRFSLLGPLTKTRPMAAMFGVIVAACVLILAVSALGLLSDTYNLDGNQLFVQAIKYEDAVIVAVNKKARQNGFTGFFRSVPVYTGAVDVAVQPVPKAGESSRQPEEISYHKIFFTFEAEEFYRFSVPFDADELALVFKTERKTLGITVKPK